MDGWMDGRMDGWMDGRMDGWIDGWINGWKEGKKEESKERVGRDVNGIADGWVQKGREKIVLWGTTHLIIIIYFILFLRFSSLLFRSSFYIVLYL